MELEINFSDDESTLEGDPRDIQPVVAGVDFSMPTTDVAALVHEKKIGPNTYMCDSAATSHMGPGDEGMVDFENTKMGVKVGNGEMLEVSKVGKRKVLALQEKGNISATLGKYKQVPKLWCNLFSMPMAMQDGWKLGNEDKVITLTKGKVTLRFENIIPVGDSFVATIELVPQSDSANPTLAAGKSMDINNFHCLFNHCAEETLRLTAKALGIQLRGKLKPCWACASGNAKKKAVAKTTETRSDKPGERVFLDISYIKHPSYGGSQYWLLIVDDATGKSWTHLLKHKDMQLDVLLCFFREMKKNGTPVSNVRLDNSGENQALQKAVKQTSDLKIKFEFTPRDSPQYNGKVERRFAFLWNAVRANLNAAKLPTGLRRGLWAEAARYAQLVSDHLVTAKNKDKGSAYHRFHSKAWPALSNIKPFGTMGMVKKPRGHQAKDKDNGVPMIYLGPSMDHAKDVHRFFDPTSKKIMDTVRDVQWMECMYGDWKGLAPPANYNHYTVGHQLEESDSENEIEVNQPGLTTDEVPDKADTEDNSSVGAPEVDTNVPTTPVTAPQAYVSPTARVTRVMKNLASEMLNPMAAEYVAIHSRAHDMPTGRDDSGFSAVQSLEDITMLDMLELTDFCLSAVDLAKLKSMKPEDLKPEQYKDAFDKPGVYDLAWNHPCPFQRKLWREAINKEFRKMDEMGVWKKIKRSTIPKDRRLIKCKWVFDIKRGTGRFRARLVACGYSQVGGIDFTQVFSPVVNDVTFRIMLVAKMIWKLDSYLFDVETAFLLGKLDEEIYMQIPPGMETDGDECLLLVKACYGLVQAAIQFFKFWKNILVNKLGFKSSLADPCLFHRGSGRDLVLICLYVDDGYAIGRKENILRFFEEVRAQKVKITTEESLGDYLSCEVKFNKDLSKAWLGQPHMIKKIEQTFGDEVSKLGTYKTPGTPGFSIIRPKGDDITVSAEMQSRYRSGVGMLLFLVKHSRPDISNAVRELTKCMDGASPAAYKEMLRLIKMVLDTKTKGLKMVPTMSGQGLTWNIVLYSDSDWAGDKDNRRSVSGFIMFLCGVPIMWRSKQQKTVALSSSEAEYVALSESVKEILFVVMILESVGIKVEKPVVVRVDNMGAIYMSENATTASRTRHVDTRFHFVRERIAGKEIVIVFVRSQENKSDGFTKNVKTEIYEDHSSDMVWDKSEVSDSHCRKGVKE